MKIDQINYFKELEYKNDWNAKVLYWKYGKLYTAVCYVDTFNKLIHLPQNQQDGCKALAGLVKLLREYDMSQINQI